MNRERLQRRKLLRNVAILIGSIGFVLVMFDWLIWRLWFPSWPWWVRIIGDVTGALLFWGAAELGRRAKQRIRPASASSPPVVADRQNVDE